mgnify:FL=1|tara:strand:- start:460 stop:930 length:471 start_codon:yes stop_codon:yes gene_type:complete
MIKINNIILISLVLLTSCGFKKANQISNEKFTIAEVEITGEKRLGNMIKNEVMLSSGKNSVNLLYLDIDVAKNKRVKERDEKNKITKYEIELITSVAISNNKNGDKSDYNFSNVSEYVVKENYSDTLKNEKTALNTLIKRTSSDINRNLNLDYLNK